MEESDARSAPIAADGPLIDETAPEMAVVTVNCPDLNADGPLMDETAPDDDFRPSSESEEEIDEDENLQEIILTGDYSIDVATMKKSLSLDKDDQLDDDEEIVGEIKSANEQKIDELPPVTIGDITIPPSEVIMKAGEVQSVVSKILVIEADMSTPALSINSVVCTLERKVVGRIFEVFGPVVCPFYSIRFNTESDAQAFQPGTKLFSVPSLSSNAVPDRSKGSDASNFYDEELPDHLREFSDDELEQEAAKHKKLKKKSGSARGNDGIVEQEAVVSHVIPTAQLSSRGRGSSRGRSSGRGRGSGPLKEHEQPRLSDFSAQSFAQASSGTPAPLFSANQFAFMSHMSSPPPFSGSNPFFTAGGAANFQLPFQWTQPAAVALSPCSQVGGIQPPPNESASPVQNATFQAPCWPPRPSGTTAPTSSFAAIMSRRP